LCFEVKKAGGMFGSRLDPRVFEIDLLSWSVRNVDVSGGKRKVKWEYAPTEITVASVDEAQGVGRFTITGEGSKEHQEQVVTFNTAADLIRFVSSLKKLAASLPPANSRASRRMDMDSLMLRAQLKDADVHSSDHQRSSDDMKLVRFRVRKIGHLKEELASVIRLIEVDRTNATLSLLSDDTKRAKWVVAASDAFVRLSRKTPSKTIFRRFSSGPNGETRTQEYKLFFEDASLAMQFMLMVNQLKEAKRDADTSYSVTLSDAPVQAVSIMCCSWNLGNTSPPRDLSQWIVPGHAIYAIGVQEGRYGVKEGDDAADSWKRDWADKMDAHFDVREYAQLAKEYLWEMSLTVFVRRDLLGQVSHVRRGTLACGVAGVAGNKGGICVSLSLHGTSLIFISSHMAAFQNDVENRNRDYRTISAGLRVNPLEPGVESCESHHCCIWMGDLNYRIDMKRDDVIAAIEQKDWAQLQAEDQLIKARHAGKAFVDYSEAVLNFPPTYRYHKGVTPRVYNDEKLRIPAWCDRVLWRTWEGVQLVPKYCTCVDGITTSDHSPVHAAFDLTCVRVPPSIPPHLVHDFPVFELSIEDVRVSGINVADQPQLSSCVLQIVAQCALAQVDKVWGGMLKSSRVQARDGEGAWADRFSVMLAPHHAPFLQHQHVTFKLREVVKPYKKIIGFAAVSLQGAAAACERGKAMAFMVPIRLQGLVCGTTHHCAPRMFIHSCAPSLCRHSAGQAQAAEAVSSARLCSSWRARCRLVATQSRGDHSE